MSEYILQKTRGNESSIFQALVRHEKGEHLWLWGLGLLVQVLHGLLDPLVLGVSADLLGLFGLEAVGEKGSNKKHAFANPVHLTPKFPGQSAMG